MSNSIHFGPFRAASGESWGVGWGQGEVWERDSVRAKTITTPGGQGGGSQSGNCRELSCTPLKTFVY